MNSKLKRYKCIGAKKFADVIIFWRLSTIRREEKEAKPFGIWCPKKKRKFKDIKVQKWGVNIFFLSPKISSASNFMEIIDLF